ncbi:MAG: xanthine dehydrogenase family protein subunit M [Anaerolineaceae bacterium]|nr:xanthine dehydrogenase family protein subunit M [Anaerolineaceae bacterium]
MLNPHPGLPEFTYVKPASLDEACSFLAEHAGEARLISGGTDLLVRMRDKAYKPAYIVDIKGLDGTDVLTFDPKSGLKVGAAVPMNRMASHPDVQKYYPLLAKAANSVASYQIRNRATIVGNICNASPAGDTLGACLVLGGRLHIYGTDGERFEDLVNFFKGPGKTTLRPGEIVTAVSFPLPEKGAKGAYIKLGRNKLSDLAIVGVTAYGFPDKKTESGFRFIVALASVAATPLMPPAVETILAEKKITEETIAEAATAAMDACSPIDDVRGSATYRKDMVRNLTRNAISDVWGQLQS